MEFVSSFVIWSPRLEPSSTLQSIKFKRDKPGAVPLFAARWIVPTSVRHVAVSGNAINQAHQRSKIQTGRLLNSPRPAGRMGSEV
jgi:hypothetical protein